MSDGGVPEGLFDEAVASPEATSADALASLQNLGREALDLEAEVEALERQVASKNTRLYDIRTKDMVDIMTQAKVDGVTVDGRVFELGKKYKANIPKEDPEPGLNWLEENEAGHLISNVVTCAFPKECEEEAKAAEQYLRERYQMAEVERARSVPWARLTSWLKSMFETESTADEASKIPLEPLGASVTRIVEIKKPKRGKR